MWDLSSCRFSWDLMKKTEPKALIDGLLEEERKLPLQKSEGRCSNETLARLSPAHSRGEHLQTNLRDREVAEMG